jgi:predicted oxidoreductase
MKTGVQTDDPSFKGSLLSTRREFLTQTAVVGMVAATSVQLAQAVAKDVTPDAKTPMKTAKVPRTDIAASRIAFGCAMLGWDWDSPDFVTKSIPIIQTAVDQGITFFDTADVYGYGKAETALGEVLKASPGLRAKLIIQTKVGDRFREGEINNTYEHIMAAVAGSLERLGTDHVDGLLLHWPDSLVNPAEVAKAFDELKHKGRVRYFGVSNHSPNQIELLQKYVRQPLVANQIQLGLMHWYTEVPIEKGFLTHGFEGVVSVDYARVHDIQIQAYSPLRADNFSVTSLLKPPADATPEIKKAAQILSELGMKYRVSPAAVMIAWLLRHPAGIVPIIGATKSEHVVENAAAANVDLTHLEWYSLMNAAAAIQSPKSG